MLFALHMQGSVEMSGLRFTQAACLHVSRSDSARCPDAWWRAGDQSLGRKGGN